MIPDRVSDPTGSASDSTLPHSRRRRARNIATALVAAAGVFTIATTFDASPSRAGADATGVILISWDGVRLNLLKQLRDWQPITEEPRLCPGDDDDTPPTKPK